MNNILKLKIIELHEKIIELLNENLYLRQKVKHYKELYEISYNSIKHSNNILRSITDKKNINDNTSVILSLDKPSDLKSKKFANTLINLIKQGVRSKNITLRLDFFTLDSNILWDEFKILKNKLYMNYKIECGIKNI